MFRRASEAEREAWRKRLIERQAAEQKLIDDLRESSSDHVPSDTMTAIFNNARHIWPLQGEGTVDRFIKFNCRGCLRFAPNFVYGVPTCSILDMGLLGYQPQQWVDNVDDEVPECTLKKESHEPEQRN